MLLDDHLYTKSLSKEEKKDLNRSMGWIAKGVGFGFFCGGILVSLCNLVMSLYELFINSSTTRFYFLLEIAAAFLPISIKTGLILFIIFHSLTYNKRKRLLSGTIKSGKGVINRISFPSYSNQYGSSADFFFDLQLPSGQKEKSYLRAHLAKR